MPPEHLVRMGYLEQIATLEAKLANREAIIVKLGENAAEAAMDYSAKLAKAREARNRLVQILNASQVRFERAGKDRFGRTLVEMPEVSEQLIREGLARRWRGRREEWCS